MPDKEKIIVKFPAGWNRPDIEIGMVQDEVGAYMDGGLAPFSIANLHSLLNYLETSRNVLLLNFGGSITVHNLMMAFVKEGLKNEIRDAVRDAVRDALREAKYGN